MRVDRCIEEEARAQKQRHRETITERNQSSKSSFLGGLYQATANDTTLL